MALKPKLGLSVMPTNDFREATAELFERDLVEAIEWSFDQPWNGVELPQWCEEIIDRFCALDALTGHGVTLSPLSARFSERQKSWLTRAEETFQTRKFVHASEHFGFFEAGPVYLGAPLAVPMNSESLHKGQDMMKRFADATQRPVGLENLAFAFGLEDVKRQGDFIEQLIGAVDGFLLLDLHNIYCQLENFSIPARDLLDSYPLDKVREIHISGGSWGLSSSRKRVAVRRDTHDDAVPQDVFNLAALALKLCPNIEFVFLERLGNTMPEPESQQGYREDFETMREILDSSYE